MLSRDRVLERLNVSPSTLEVLVADGIVLELRDGDESLYPEEQFSATGIDGRFSSVLAAFRRYRVTPEGVWNWFQESNAALEGYSPLQIIRENPSPDNIDGLRRLIDLQCSLRALIDPSQERTDWLRHDSTNIDENGIGDYTPKRRGGQHAS